MRGFILALFVSACAAGVVVSAGCEAYGEMRLSLPYSELEKSPISVVRWVSRLDARMTAVCR